MNDVSSIKEEKYSLLLNQIKSLLNSDQPILTNLSNITAAINQTFENISWVGFYLTKNNKLFLGPFQGKVACTQIEYGKGVCGTSAKDKLTLVVPNVHEFPGHIACDIESNSEIVVPLVQNGIVYGVLDLDSKFLSNFDEIDKEWLEKVSGLISDRLDIDKFKFN